VVDVVAVVVAVAARPTRFHSMMLSPWPSAPNDAVLSLPLCAMRPLLAATAYRGGHRCASGSSLRCADRSTAGGFVGQVITSEAVPRRRRSGLAGIPAERSIDRDAPATLAAAP
jgi:hypothetical protein